MSKIPLYVRFEDEICAIGSQLDGRNLYELITWDENDYACRDVSVIPRVGEVIELDAIWFEVLSVKHRIRLYDQTVYVLVRQIPLVDERTKW